MTKLMQDILRMTKAVPLSTDQSINHSRSNAYAPIAGSSKTNNAHAEHRQTTSLNESLGIGFLYSVSGLRDDI